MKKPHIFKQLHKENKGISLVEIIVSLLILMIIIVPMLSSFVTASKTNQSAKASSYAKSAAENVVEMVKLLGLEKTALEFHKSVTTDFQLINGCSNFEEVVLPGEYPSVISGAFVKKTSGEYEYNITGITEGTETYDIKLKLSDVQYSGSGGPNEYQYADLSAFNSKTTAVINPVLSNSTYDYRVFQYFKSMHERYKYGIYSAERDRIDSINSAIMEQYYIDVDAANSTGRPAPPLPSTLPIPTQEPYNQDDAIRNTIKKTIDISLEEVAGSTSNVYVLNAAMTYTCDNSSGAYGDIANVGSSLTKTYTGFCVNQKYEDLEAAFVIYQPFTSVASLNDETVNIDYKSNKDVDVYIAIQEAAGTAITSALNVNVSRVGTGELTLYSQADLDMYPATIPFHKTLLKDYTNNVDMLYNMSVEVFQGDGTFSKRVTTVESTLMNQ